MSGEVEISGAKNAATKMLIASLLTDQPVILHNCPHIGDVDITAELCKTVGAKISVKDNTITLHTPKIKNTSARRQSRRNRLSVLALAPLLFRAGKAVVPVVEGDAIGPRPVNFHIEALRQMGAKITENNSSYSARLNGRFKGVTIKLPYPSVMATETIIMAGVLAEGRTKIQGAAIEPEIIDLIKLLQQMGAIIELQADRTIIIDGVQRMIGAEYTIMPDRLEAASYGLMAIATDGNILVKGARQEDMITFLNTIRRLGASYRVEDGGIRFRRSRSGRQLTGIELETDTHPGFATDWQQPLTVLLTQCDGMSVIHETVYEDRFGFTESLRAMGASITVFNKCLGELPCRFHGHGQKHSGVIKGPTPLHAAEIIIPDIRAGMAHVIGALVADGTSTLYGIEHLLRGYAHHLELGSHVPEFVE